MLIRELLREEFEETNAPKAHGKFKELDAEALAKWLMKTRRNNAERVYGALAQQIRFNKDDPAYIKKMERVREIVKDMNDKE